MQKKETERALQVAAGENLKAEESAGTREMSCAQAGSGQPEEGQTESGKAGKEAIARPYTLRRLKDSDLFPLLRILKKIGIGDCKDAFIQVISGGKSLEQVGIAVSLDIAEILIGNLEKLEDDIYGLWSELSGIPAEEMREMEFGTLPLMILDTFSEAGNTSFFRALSRFLS